MEERHAGADPVSPVTRVRNQPSSPQSLHHPLTVGDAGPHHLPILLTGFVGREREAAEVTQMLGSTRLLTLSGTGGVGKTRLALEVAAGLFDEYPDGVRVVELAALTDPVLVPQVVAASLDVREEAGRPMLETLTDALRGKRLLILLDNCEHLVRACGVLVDELLREAALI
jgi:AAA domain